MERGLGHAVGETLMDWNRRYEMDDTPWDQGEAHPVLLDMLTHGTLVGRVLVPGCGTGHDVRELARRGLEVVGLDVASLALERALSHALVGRETYQLGDLFHAPEHWHHHFDGIFEHTCFCAIEPARRPDYVAAVAEVLKPGGHLLAVFFVNPDNNGQGPPFGCTAAELDVLFGEKFRLREEHRAIPTYPERAGRELLRVYQRV